MATAAIENNWPAEGADNAMSHYNQQQGGGGGEGLRQYYLRRIHDLQLQVRRSTHDLQRLEAQRNDLNSRGL